VETGSKLIDTECGPIEYAEVGDGPPVLLIHGTSGGYVQGLLLVQRLGTGFRYIIPSRFGYFRTPLPADASPIAQAEAHICLLDALHIQQAGIWGVSAGALSAMELAARYPERVAALELVSPAAWSPDMAVSTPPLPAPVTGFITNVVLKNDTALWLLAKTARPVMLGFLATPASLESKFTPTERATVDQIIETLYTVSAQGPGIFNDAKNHEQRQRAPLEQIVAPTLVISAADDLYQTMPGAEYTAQNISGAQLVRLDHGGHLLTGGQEWVWEASARFLAQHPAAAQ
jgi:2-hydroxy-6-oxonona-2,4-dienedioate hydrolase